LRITRPDAKEGRGRSQAEEITVAEIAPQAPLVEGRFDRPGVAHWFFAGMAVLLFGVLLFFGFSVLTGGARWDEMAPALLTQAIGALVCGLIFLFGYLRAGAFRMTRDALFLKRRLGSPRQIPLAEIKEIAFGEDSSGRGFTKIIGRRSEELIRLRGVPVQAISFRGAVEYGAGGGLWLAFRYGSRAPAEVFERLARDPQGKAEVSGFVRDARWVVYEGERPRYHGRCLIADIDGRRLMLPTTAAGEIPGVGAALGIIAGVHVDKSISFGDGSAPPALPAAGFVAALLGSGAPGEVKREILADLSRGLGGAFVAPREGEAGLFGEQAGRKILVEL
jgi:hypothetical protein